MLVFTITNNTTDDVWVGTCKDSSDERFEQFQEAMALDIKEPFYKDLRDYGVQNFTIDDFAVAEDREELKDLFNEAMETHKGRSLTGIKTSLGKTSIAKASPLKSSVHTARAVTKTISNPFASRTLSITPSKINAKPVKEKLASGRTGSASKERLIKEKMAEEKALRDSTKSKQIMEQADEMAAILARLDSRGSSLNTRRK